MSLMPKLKVMLVAASALLGGCAGYIGGELSRMKFSYEDVIQCPSYGETEFAYAIDTNIQNGGAPGVMPAISAWTLGIIPTYRPVFGWSRATLFKGEQVVGSREYKVRVHEFYGFLWYIPLYPAEKLMDESNIVPVNEGIGLGSGWGVKRKTAAVANAGFKERIGIEAKDLCYRYTLSI